MALILNIETSTRNCSVSVARDGKLVALCEESKENYEHAEKLHRFMQWALEAEDLSFEDLDAVCVSKGPGSYTGLRIGVSAAKGLCFSLNIPLLSLNSLEILARSVENENNADYIIPMIDARRKEVYTATFTPQMQIIEKTNAKILDETSFQSFNNKKIIVLGDGASKASEILKLENATYLTESLPSAKDMCAESFKLYQNQQFEDVAYFEPFYLKDFVAGK
ncbi:tRNA (adenosine(37)-N6)-threonylcarbamoyltransferase complex dimerization subunit type 1 TsaB [Ornithobacterium rhinotracheale]|uniref:Universal bacterial protein YeaZ n=1 Tax=Ornithobacterium rhinotracheale (strain ATCC 51463 / DSM 15997 / CCUG 23171 / CIP 104009 / LMG 9086) TaxID=867902 RepID=I4A0W6_ORNRL|nr:tRNA (adenosine(37)-N6)-threonylcarbamoyltransferase complex dimerization subunit type 1 TsaB [Ornithobacterium rhinotracheale]AFL97600.1 universal bacterial protein YeaZ [Ornithobacterium rhinotracheale DSM 15997]AIP98887.1 peptidase M22 [Ornithobacterium rhinotracheale ORT-UMN 88]KGB66846.1 peptidase M22 [Ornithobacterium rhinotracheale H06-030791]MBN3661849.1 tRNA (adenosine(37)-N6)-threonylcarbamoyltransferase complex dimerization subunit type 1 TsaB [Ornithobacterium rhinotracheale]MCK